MKKSFQLQFFILSIVSVVLMLSIGIMVAQRSILGIIISLFLLLSTIGYAFSQKKKQRSAT